MLLSCGGARLQNRQFVLMTSLATAKLSEPTVWEAGAAPEPVAQTSGTAAQTYLLWAGILVAALAGLILRIEGAQGDLWLDEIWSVDLVSQIASIDQVLWRINQDNNHYLNSAYLYLVGVDAAPLVARGFSVALGTMAVLAAAAFNWKDGKCAAFATALLFVVSYPMVNYGSEARGYVGLVLCTIVALIFAERRLAGSRYGVALGLAILIGVLFHMTMLEAVAVCGLWTLWVLWRRTGNIGHVWRETLSIYTPAVRFLLPLFLVIVVAKVTLGFAIGGLTPFTIDNFTAGYGGMIRHLFALPDWVGNWPAIGLVCCGVLAAAQFERSERGSLFVIGIVILPAIMFAARLPNLEFPRYFLVPGTMIMLLAGSVVGREMAAGGVRQFASIAVLCAFVAGSALSLAQFFELRRGSYGPIVAQMAADGPTTYGTGQDLRVRRMVDYFARRLSASLTHVPADEWCAKRPQWVVIDEPDQPDRVDASKACALSYDRIVETHHSALSGRNWTLYRRVD